MASEFRKLEMDVNRIRLRLLFDKRGGQITRAVCKTNLSIALTHAARVNALIRVIFAAVKRVNKSIR